jgi:hypothetical protein
MVRIARMRHAGVMPDLPMPFRAALGLVATAMDEARRLPDRALELPMLAVGTVLQVSMRAQQRYAELVARGDELISRQQVGDEPPAWATFDEPVDHADTSVPQAPPKSVRSPRYAEPSRFDTVDDD